MGAVRDVFGLHDETCDGSFGMVFKITAGGASLAQGGDSSLCVMYYVYDGQNSGTFAYNELLGAAKVKDCLTLRCSTRHACELLVYYQD
jgi:hypothetical protein